MFLQTVAFQGKERERKSRQLMKITYIFIPLVLLVATSFAQEIPSRYWQVKRLLDFKGYYTVTATPSLDIQYTGYHITYINNLKLNKGDGTLEPWIGFSLNPSINWSKFMADKDQVKSTLLLDGLINFVPSLYLSVKPEKEYPFHLFVNAGGGVKLFPKLSNLDVSTPLADRNDGVFDQWVFELGSGLDYDNKVSLSFKYVRGWHDLTKSTEGYYRRNISANGSTFIDYFTVRGNFTLSKYAYAFLEWNGYNSSFDKERVYRAGIGLQLAKTEFEKADGSKNQQKEQNKVEKRRISQLKRRASALIEDLDILLDDQELKITLADSTINKLKNQKGILEGYLNQIKALENDLSIIRSQKELKSWLRRYNRLRKNFPIIKVNLKKVQDRKTNQKKRKGKRITKKVSELPNG